MIASYNHVYQVVFGTTYTQLGAVGVSYYGEAEIGAPFHMEFLAFSDDPKEVVQAIRNYPMRPGERHVVNVFHATPYVSELINEYTALGYEFRQTSPILAVELPLSGRESHVQVQLIQTPEQLELANRGLAIEGERIHPQSLHDPAISNYCAMLEGRVAGWSQVVYHYPATAYVNQLYTLTSFRRRGVARALMDRVHADAWARECQHVVLIPSQMAMPMYYQFGYRPRLYFSVFRPKEP